MDNNIISNSNRFIKMSTNDISNEITNYINQFSINTQIEINRQNDKYLNITILIQQILAFITTMNSIIGIFATADSKFF